MHNKNNIQKFSNSYYYYYYKKNDTNIFQNNNNNNNDFFHTYRIFDYNHDFALFL